MFAKLKFAPGIVRDTTAYTNTGGWYDGAFVRFRNGLPEKIGGWAKFYTSQTPLTGTCRKMYAWSSLNGTEYMAIPTNKKFYVDNQSEITDVSPTRRLLTLGNNPIATTSGSSIITITDTNHGASANDYVILTGATTVGGIGSGNLNKEHVIASVTGTDTYTVDTGATAGSTATGGGASVVARYLFYSGSGFTSVFSGYGAGGYGGTEGATSTFVLGAGSIATNTGTNTTISGIDYTTITVTTPSAHGAAIGDSIVMTGTSAVGGVLPAYMEKALEILTTPTATTFTTRVEGTATSTTSGGGTPTLSIYSALTNFGWGDSPTTTTTTTFTGMWSVDNYGEDMIACPRDMVLGVSLGSNPIATTNASTTVTVTQTNHGFETGDAPILSGLEDVGGIDALYLNGSHTITKIDADTYTFVASVAASSTTSGGGSSGSCYISPIVYWDSSANGRAISLSYLGTDYAKSFLPYSATEILISDSDRHVIALGANPFDPTLPLDKMIIRWSDSRDPSNWNAEDPDATAGELRCSSGSYIVTGAQSREEILVWTDTSLYSLAPGSGFTFGLQLVGTGFDIIGPNAKIVIGTTAYWMGSNNFYIYDGKVSQLPCPIRDYVFLDINRDLGINVYASTDSANNEIIWFYASSSSMENDRYVMYNYAENCWYYGPMGRTAHIDRGTTQYPRAMSEDGYIYNHEYGFDDGSETPAVPIDAYVTSSPIEIDDGFNYMYVNRIIPDVDFRGTDLSISPEPVVKFTIQTQNFPGGETYPGNTRSIQRNAAATLMVNRFTTQAFTRLRARSVSLKVESDGLGTSWRLGTPRLDMRPDGRK